MTKSIKGNYKNYSVSKKSGIKRDMEKGTWEKPKIKSKMIELNPTRVNPSEMNPDIPIHCTVQLKQSLPGARAPCAWAQNNTKILYGTVN